MKQLKAILKNPPAGWIHLAVARNLVYWNEEAAEKTKDAIERLGSVLSRLKKD